MLAHILDSPIIDILLVILAIRYVLPSIFKFKVVRLNQQQQQPYYHQNEEGSIHIKSSVKNKANNKDDGDGEYIEYEEVK